MKKIKYFVIGTALFFSSLLNASAGASISTNKSQVYVGDSFTTSITISGVATWNVYLKSSGPVSNCTLSQAGYTDDLSETSKTFSAICNTTGSGTANVTLSGTITNGAGNTTKVMGTKNVKIINKPVENKTPANSKPINNSSKKEVKKSNNNYLKSLSVEGNSISPEFDKDKTEYTVIVPNDTQKIVINAEKDSDKASLSGNGEKELKEEDNIFEIVVTAENKSKKVYKLSIKKDSKPINVNVDGKKYILIKNKDELPELKREHEDLILNIEDQEIPSYRIDSINYVLVGLKDEEGNIKLFKFDSYKNEPDKTTYTKYNELDFNNLSIILMNFNSKKIPSNYKKYLEKINDNEVEVYKLNKNSKYSLIYGLNIESGKENIYRYDKVENTIQIYDREEIEELELKKGKYEKLIIILSGVIIFLIIVVTIVITKKRKKIIVNLDDEK